MRAFWAALGLLTRLPVPRGQGAPPAGFAAFFPLAGAAVGVLTSAAWYLLFQPLGALSAAAGALMVSALSTGGLHMDGFLDTADGLGSRRPAPDALRIMRDSRAGGLGVVYLATLLVAKLALLGGTPFPGGWRVLLLYPVLSRSGMVLAAWRAVYPREAGLGGTVVGRVGTGELVAALLIGGLAGWFLAGFRGEVALGVVLLAVVGGRAFLARRLGGLTGDTLGALNEVGEVAALAALLWRWGTL